MHDVTFKGYGREVKMHRADGQGLEAQLFGVTKKSDKYPFKVLADITIVPAELVTPGVADTSMEWIDKSLTPDVLKSDQIKAYAN
jgi:branched-chain amino acid transport system substrate-binding protein